jgi:hypothetical protein
VVRVLLFNFVSLRPLTALAFIAWLALFVVLAVALSSCGMTPALAQPVTENLVSGSGSATGTSATQIIAAPSGTRRIYVTSVQCGRTDAGTSAIYVTLNDDGATVLVIPNAGNGGDSNMMFGSPLTVAASNSVEVYQLGECVDALLQRAGLHRELGRGVLKRVASRIFKSRCDFTVVWQAGHFGRVEGPQGRH